MIDDSWGIGLCGTAGGQVAVGAQLRAEGDVGYQKGTAGFKAGLKAGLGPGAGVTFGAEVTGLDKLGDKIRGLNPW